MQSSASLHLPSGQAWAVHQLLWRVTVAESETGYLVATHRLSYVCGLLHQGTSAACYMYSKLQISEWTLSHLPPGLVGIIMLPLVPQTSHTNTLDTPPSFGETDWIMVGNLEQHVTSPDIGWWVGWTHTHTYTVLLINNAVGHMCPIQGPWVNSGPPVHFIWPVRVCRGNHKLIIRTVRLNSGVLSLPMHKYKAMKCSLASNQKCIKQSVYGA